MQRCSGCLWLGMKALVLGAAVTTVILDFRYLVAYCLFLG